MDLFERQVRITVIQTLRDTGGAPSTSDIAGTLGAAESRVVAALRSLHTQHRLVLVPGTDRVMMAHPFSGIATDFVVTIGQRRWFANCVWDGLAILALLGDGTMATHSSATAAQRTWPRVVCTATRYRLAAGDTRGGNGAVRRARSRR